MSQTGEENMGTRISIIAAIGLNRELGKENESGKGDLIWRIPDDLKRVKALTMGHPIIMGRKTHESIGRPLPGRTNIVVSSSVVHIPGCTIAESLGGALEIARAIEHSEIFIFGGARVYADSINLVDRLYLTVIHAEDITANVFFPPYQEKFSRLVAKEKHIDEASGLTYEWVTLERTRR